MIVRPLTDADAAAFTTLCAQDSWRYLTPRLNIEAHGYNGPIVQTWGAFRAAVAGAGLAGVMLRYGNTAILADADGATAEVFAPVIDGLDGLAGVRGSIEAVRAIRGLLSRYAPTGMEHSTFMGLSMPPQCPAHVPALARRARPGDLDLLAELYSNAYAMHRSRANVAAKLTQTRVFVVERRPDRSPGAPHRLLCAAQCGGRRRGLDRRRLYPPLCARTRLRRRLHGGSVPGSATRWQNALSVSTKTPLRAASTRGWASRSGGSGPYST